MRAPVATSRGLSGFGRAVRPGSHIAQAPSLPSMANDLPGDPEVTRMLEQGADANALLPLVYEELRRIASQRMRNEPADHTLQATALVNEAYMRLLGTNRMSWQGRQQFYAAASESMRRVLVDHARKVRSQKRGGDRQQVSLLLADNHEEVMLDADRFLALDEALDILETEDARAAEITRLRFFGGLTMANIAETLELSERTVHREWTFARTRLHQLLDEND